MYRISDYSCLNIISRLNIISGESRIFCWGCQPRWRRGHPDVRCGHFSAKTYAKMKELDPVGGAPPPRILQRYDRVLLLFKHTYIYCDENREAEFLSWQFHCTVLYLRICFC